MDSLTRVVKEAAAAQRNTEQRMRTGRAKKKRKRTWRSLGREKEERKHEMRSSAMSVPRSSNRRLSLRRERRREETDAIIIAIASTSTSTSTERMREGGPAQRSAHCASLVVSQLLLLISSRFGRRYVRVGEIYMCLYIMCEKEEKGEVRLYIYSLPRKAMPVYTETLTIRPTALVRRGLSSSAAAAAITKSHNKPR